MCELYGHTFAECRSSSMITTGVSCGGCFVVMRRFMAMEFFFEMPMPANVPASLQAGGVLYSLSTQGTDLRGCTFKENRAVSGRGFPFFWVMGRVESKDRFGEMREEKGKKGGGERLVSPSVFY